MGTLFNYYSRYARGEKKNLILDILFVPISWIIGFIMYLTDLMRRHGFLITEEPALPVISVGNLTYGGTNKTPFVKMLAEFVKTKGIKVGIVTRGYSGKTNNVIIIKNGEGERTLTGDEPLLLSKELHDVPVAIAKKRIDGVNALKKSGVELVIADDAFQHRIMSRDVDIVLIDSLCPFGSGNLIPAGTMREKITALKRADMVVLTKSEQISPKELEKLYDTVKKFISEEKIFTSKLKYNSWILYGKDVKEPKNDSKVFAFSAIGSPESFITTLKGMGLNVVGTKNFRDHHNYSHKDLENLYNEAKMQKNKVEFMTCTEKDLYNFPEICKWSYDTPLAIPKIKIELNERNKFFIELEKCLQPKIVVASNGYGEDAIGVMLAKKLRKRLPNSKILAFPLVGRGDAYIKEGFEVKSAPSVTPSGGVLKYSVKDLWGDMRAGLFKHIKAQLSDWKKLAGKIMTPICVGDVYLLLHALLGSGARPMFVATAKTVYLSGHWRLERAIINKFTVRTWTRDAKSAEQFLTGRKAVYMGNPVMDLLNDDDDKINYERGNVVLILPGSRLRAYKDVKLLLEAVEIMEKSGENEFRMVLAPTLPYEDFFRACKDYGWEKISDKLTKNTIKISLSFESIAKSVKGVKILLGLGGTANQLCAGLGIPVISIDEKGKRVQKKLLGDSEILTSSNSKDIANTALRILNDKELYNFMSKAGKERMGKPGAIDDIIKYTCENFGWNIREKVYMKIIDKN